MSFNVNNIPFAYLVQPELLEEQDIRNILIDRCVRVDNIEYLNKEQLLNIFYRVVTPLQQRQRTDHTRNSIDKNISKVNNDRLTLKNGIAKDATDEDNAKKMKISSSPTKVHLKRPCIHKNNVDEVPVLKKARQKITWP